MSNRFHNKFHRHNHHTRPTDRDGKYPDSAYDPIASPDSPFEGEFYVDGNITALSSISALGDLFASNGTFHEDVVIEGNLSVLGTTTQLDTFVYVTSAVDITNVGTGPALKVTQTGSEPIAHFIDSNGDDIVFADNGYVGLGTYEPSEKLTVSGNVSSSGTTTVGTIPTGSTNDVIVKSTNNTLHTRPTNPAIWDTATRFISASTGLLSANYLTKATDSYGISESIVYDDGTNVGIGTTSPNEKLTISGNLSASGTVAVGTLDTGTENSFVIESNGLLQKRSLNAAATDTASKFVSASDGSLTTNYLTKAGNAYGVQQSIVFDDGISIGINETSPEGKLHVTAGSAGSVVAQTSSVGVFESSGHAYLSLLSPTSKYAGVVMGGPTNPYGSYVSWNHDNLALKVATNHAGASIQMLAGTEQEALRITSAGNVGVGTTSPNEKLTVSGNISASGTATIGNIATGTGNSFIIESDGLLQKRSLNDAAVNTVSKFVSASDGSLTTNYLTKATNSNGINESIISDDGTLVYVGGNLTISGNLTALGSSYFANTIFTTTSALSVVNIGPGPALYVYQGPGTSDVASFYDGDGIEVLHVGNCDPGQQFGKVGVNTGDPNKELTVRGEISATGTIYADSIILSGRSLEDVVTTTTNVTADLSAGAIAPGNVVPAGTSLQKFVEQLITKTFYPTFTNPSASLGSNLASTVESGTTGITLTVTLNRGAITGKSIGGIWQPATFQDFRSGAATNYLINGTNNGTTNSLAFPSVVIADGSNSFSSTTSYAQGPQPVDSKNITFSTPLAAGTTGASVTVTGARRGFYGVSSLANTSALIRSVGNSTSPGVSNGTSFTINIPSGATSVIFAYPATLQNVTTVKYVEGLNAEVKNNFTQTTVAVEGLNSYTAINYKVYRYVPVEPFPSSATYNVTI